MKGNTKRHLLRADKIFMNIWEIPLLNPGQLISSDWINFFFLPSVTLNILTVIHLFYEYEFISAFLSFAFFACLHIFNLKTVTFIPLWHPVKTHSSDPSLSMETEFGKWKRWDDLSSRCIPVVHPQIWMIITLTKSYSRPCIRPSSMGPWP